MKWKGPLTLTVHETWRTLGRTLRTWFTPIIRMWRFSRNNGITEGFHRKMKLIQRRAYGFRNFECYRLRILIECGHFYIPQKDGVNNVFFEGVFQRQNVPLLSASHST